MSRMGRYMLVFTVILVAGSIGFLRSPAFRLEEVVIDGLVSVEAEQILEATDLQGGRHLYSISLGEIRRQIDSDPRIDPVSIKRILPGQLEIIVRERVPVVVVVRGGVFAQVDEEGRIIAVDESWPGLQLPVLTGYEVGSLDLGAPALDPECNGLFVAANAADLLPYISEIRSAEAGPILVTVDGGEYWFPATDSEISEALERIREVALPGSGCVHDYRLPERPVRRCP